MGLALILCLEPVCSVDGRWCEEHRHRKGSMGYPDWSPVDVVYHGYEPDGPGFWDWVKARWKTLIRTPLQIAQMARDEQMQQFEKMAPVPDLTYHVGERTFTNGRPNGRMMMEVGMMDRGERMKLNAALYAVVALLNVVCIPFDVLVMKGGFFAFKLAFDIIASAGFAAAAFFAWQAATKEPK